VDYILRSRSRKTVILRTFVQGLSSHGQVNLRKGGFHCCTASSSAGILPRQICCFRLFQVVNNHRIHFFRACSCWQEVLGGGRLWSRNQRYISIKAYQVEIGPSSKEACFTQNLCLTCFIHWGNCRHFL